MGVIVRESVKSSLINYIGVVFGAINVLFIYNKLLSTEEYGLYAILLSFPIVGVGFINLGIPPVCIRFFNRFADKDKKYFGVFTFLLTAPLISFLIFLGLFYGFQNIFVSLYQESPKLVKYAWALPPLTLFLLYQVVLEAYLKVHLKVVFPAAVREIFQKISNCVLVVAYYFDWINFNQMVWGLILVFFLAVVFLLIYIYFKNYFYWEWKWEFLNSPFRKEMLVYGLWTMFGGAMATALPHLEKIILPMFTDGLSNTAIFTLALNIAIVIAIPRNTIASISDPIIAKAWSENNLLEIKTIYTKSALNLMIIGLFLFLYIWTCIDNIFAIIPNSDKYSSGKYVVFMLGIANVFDMATGVNSEIIKNSKYFRFDFLLFFIRFFILTIANIILIPKFSYNGAASAILVSTILYNLLKYIYLWRKFRMQPFGLKTLKVLGLAFVAYLFSYIGDWYEGNNLVENFLEIFTKGIIMVLIFGFGVYFTGVSSDLNQIVNEIRARILKK